MGLHQVLCKDVMAANLVLLLHFFKCSFSCELNAVSLMVWASQLYNQFKVYCFSTDDTPMERTINKEKKNKFTIHFLYKQVVSLYIAKQPRFRKLEKVVF